MGAEAELVRHLPRVSGQSAFGTDAAGYHAGRIGYPERLYDGIFSRAQAHPRVLEIGAGTGLATASLLARDPVELVIVESDAALHGYLEAHFDDPRLTVLNATFPEARVAGPFDIALCAAAFHWLDPQAALARVRELLRPGGVWAMWWNAYRNPNDGDPLAQAITPLLSDIALSPSEQRDGHYSLNVPHHVELLRNAGFREIEHCQFRRTRSLGVSEVRALYASYSYVRALQQQQREKLLDDITSIVDKTFGGAAPNHVITSVYSAVA